MSDQPPLPASFPERGPSRSVVRTRAALLHGALASLAAEGPDASIDSITERANVAHGTFYEHFETRQDLLTEAMTNALADFNGRIDEQLPESASACEELALRMRYFGRMPELHPTLAAAFSSAGGFEVGFATSFLEHIDSVIARGIANGEFGDADPAAAFATVTGSSGWLVAVRTAYPHNGTDRVDAVAEFVLTLLDVDPGEAHALCSSVRPHMPTRKSRTTPARLLSATTSDVSRRALAQQDRSRKTRSSIVQAALTLLADEGTHLSIDRITKQAGVSRASFYRYFATKDELFEAASIEGMQEWEDYIFDITASIEDPADRFVMAMRLYGRLPDSHPHVARAFCNLGNFAAGYPNGTEPDYQALYDEAIKARRFAPDPQGIGFLTLAGTLEWLVTQRVVTTGITGDFTDAVLGFVLPGFGLSPAEVTMILQQPSESSP